MQGGHLDGLFVGTGKRCPRTYTVTRGLPPTPHGVTAKGIAAAHGAWEERVTTGLG